MNFELFYSRLRSVLLDYNIIDNVLNFHFSNSAISIAKLSGDYTDCWECHIKSDWLLVWKQNDDELTLLFTNTGTHSDLF